MNSAFYTAIYLGAVWILSGVLGLLGIRPVPKKYKGHWWTKDYKRAQGLFWLLLGLTELVMAFTSRYVRDLYVWIGITLLCFVPTMIYGAYCEKKYKKMYEREQLNKETDFSPREQ